MFSLSSFLVAHVTSHHLHTFASMNAVRFKRIFQGTYLCLLDCSLDRVHAVRGGESASRELKRIACGIWTLPASLHEQALRS